MRARPKDMRNVVDGPGLSRRSLLALSGAYLIGGSQLWASTEFWNKKAPADWTGEEIDLLTTKSPWAKQVTAKYAPGEGEQSRQGGGGGGSRGGGGGGRPTIGIGGIGIGLPGGRGRGGRQGGPGRGAGQGAGESQYKGTVRWESAQPIRDALKSDLPEGFANHYVIGVRDIPLREEDRPRSRRNDDDDPDSSNGLSKDAEITLKQATVLQVKNGDMVEAAMVKQMTPGGTWFLFGFRKAELDFGKNDHEIDFSTRLGTLIVKTRFDLSLMKYHGKLAV